MSGSSEKLRDEGTSHKSSSSKPKPSRSKSSKSLSSKSISSKSASSKSTTSGRADVKRVGMGGNSSGWVQYQARLRQSRQIRRSTSKKDGINDSCSSASSKRSTISKHSAASGHSTRSRRSASSKSSKGSHGENRGGTIKSEVVRGDKSSARSTILKSENLNDGEIDDLSDQNIGDRGNEGKLASDDVSIDVNNE